MSILVTGTAGFLGLHVAEALLACGETVIGVDTLEAGGDPALQAARLQRLDGRPGYTFLHAELTAAAIDEVEITGLVHLAAPVKQVCGHLGVLDWCLGRLPALRHVVYPSAMPDDLLALAYARLHSLPQTAVRLGDVYGPWGQADDPYFALADAIVAGRPVTLSANAALRLLYVDDAVAGILAALDRPPADARTPPRVLDLAGDAPVDLERLVTVLEDSFGRQVERRHADWRLWPTDERTLDLATTEAALGWRPTTAVEDGMAAFVAWHRHQYGG